MCRHCCCEKRTGFGYVKLARFPVLAVNKPKTLGEAQAVKSVIQLYEHYVQAGLIVDSACGCCQQPEQVQRT